MSWSLCVRDAVGADWGFRDRTTKDHVIWYLSLGGIDLNAEGRVLPLRAGSLVWMPPGLLASARIAAGMRGKFGYSFRFRLDIPPGPLRWLPTGQATLPLMERIYQDHCLGGARAEVRIRASLYLLWTELDEPASPPPAGLTTHQRQTLVTWFDRNQTTRARPADLAALVGLSPDWFARRFRQSFGMSPRRWLVASRMRVAAGRFEHGDEPVGRIAADLGYADANLFARQFRAVMGASPARWRRR